MRTGSDFSGPAGSSPKHATKEPAAARSPAARVAGGGMELGEAAWLAGPPSLDDEAPSGSPVAETTDLLGEEKRDGGVEVVPWWKSCADWALVLGGLSASAAAVREAARQWEGGGDLEHPVRRLTTKRRFAAPAR